MSVLKSLVDNTRTDKNTRHCYLDIYEQLFSPIRQSAKNILEVGIRDGGSLKLWYDFFPNATIYGVDTMEEVKEIWSEIKKPRIKILPHDAYDLNFLHAFTSSGTRFDMLLDDGPHTLDSMLFFAANYSPLLTPTGVLVIEDIPDPAWLPKIAAAFPERFRPYLQIADLRTPQRGVHDDILMILDMSRVSAPVS
jgi:hypothetical protein